MSDPILVDYTDWNSLKERSIYYADVFKKSSMFCKGVKRDFALKSYRSLLHCGDYLEFKQFQDNSLKLHKAYFCKHRYCPMCNHRRYHKMIYRLSRIMDFLSSGYFGSRFIFITLTCASVPVSDLHKTCVKMRSAYKLLRQRLQRLRSDDGSSVFLGEYCTLEVTYSIVNNIRMAHPHYHIIAHVTGSYFSYNYQIIEGKRQRIYKYWLSQNSLKSMWSDLLSSVGLHGSVVDIRTVYAKGPDGRKITRTSVVADAIKEAAKYATKFEDVSNPMQLLDAAYQTKGLQFYSFSGSFRSAQRVLFMDTDVDDDLIHIKSEDFRSDLEYIIVKYRWFAHERQYGLVAERKYLL